MFQSKDQTSKLYTKMNVKGCNVIILVLSVNCSATQVEESNIPII